MAAQGVIAGARDHRPADQGVRGAHPLPRGARARRPGYKAEGLSGSSPARDTWDLIVERGQQDMDLRSGRFRACSRRSSRCPLTWPTSDLQWRDDRVGWQARGPHKQLSAPHQGRHHRHLPPRTSFRATWSSCRRRLLHRRRLPADWPQTLDNLAAMNFAKLVVPAAARR